MSGPNTDAIAAERPRVVGDIWGGLAAMLVALPAAIAFGVAIFAPLGGGLGAQGALAGILGATVLGLVAPSFGGAPRLVTAPSAPAAAVLSALAAGFVQQGTAPGTVVLLLGLIGLLAGMIQVALGLAGIGRLIRYIPYPVVSGYLTGVGLIIIGSQLPRFLGVPHELSVIPALLSPSAWRWQSLLVGCVVIAAMVLLPRIIRTVPAAILALAAGVLAYLALGIADPSLLRVDGNPFLIGTLADGNSPIADVVGRHWRSMSVPHAGDLAQVLAPALTLAVLLSIDTLKTCLVLDAMSDGHHDPNRELVGQGLGNLATSLVGGVPGSGTMGASLVNVASGGATRLSGFMAGAFALAAFLLLTSAIAWVPLAALAGILIVVGARMIDRHSLTFFFARATRLDFIVIVAVVLSAIFVNLIVAAGVGVALAVLLFVREQTHSTVVRTRIEGREVFSKRARTAEKLEAVERSAPDTVIFELQGALFFGTANRLQAALEPETATRKYVVLQMRRVQSLDVTATHVLELIKDRLERRDAFLLFCDIPKGLPSGLKMKRYLKETGVVKPSAKALTFDSLDDALEWIESRELAGLLPAASSEAMELRDFDIFAGCTDEAMRALEAAIQTRAVRAQKKVYKAGTPTDALYLVRRGTLKLLVPVRKKDSYHLSTCGPGEIIGGMGFMAGGNHLVDLVALTDSELYVLTRERFEELAVEHGDLALAIFGHVAHTLSLRLRIAIGEVQALRG
ncbi:MAG TPA: SulP family inorganic anion transporter [Rhodocyclaceae bacterium]|nr:SulP family inorganic anion transporter [Rhodocyclaceae bacterium]